ncbi:hypothetical protein NUW58_g2871 [Xylaria curta]|uniref:Uncharacterized protein n=1 Tax=Xylaria curta TaxID=42375 RepID=A0ACC1PFW8_9PEZI|nr:hypothetical protein NUW58_g2871 [Xylaria curta]
MATTGSSSPAPSSAQWFLTPTDEPPFYRLHSTALGEGQSLDVVNDNGTSSINVQMAATGNYSGQYWRFDQWPADPAGTYRLTNNFTGIRMNLDVYSNTLQPHLASGDHSGQHWTLNPAPAVFSVMPPGVVSHTPSASPTTASASVSTTTSITVPEATSVTISTTSSASGVTVEFAWR